MPERAVHVGAVRLPRLWVATLWALVAGRTELTADPRDALIRDMLAIFEVAP